MKRRTLLQLAAAGAAQAALPRLASAAPLDELRLDYAYYSPTSLVLRHFGWLEQEFKPDGTAINGRFITHNGRINIAFADGHIETMKDKQVREIQTGIQQKIYFDPFYR